LITASIDARGRLDRARRLENGCIKVCVEHRDPLLAAGVAAALQLAGGFEIVRGNASAAATSSWIRESHTADVLIADYDTALRLAGEAGRRGAILILTQFDSEAHIRRAIQQGIRGYLLQSCSSEALVEGVLALHRGATAFAPAVAARVAESMTYQRLTDRELTVLHHVMLGLSNKQISHRLAMSVGTVKTHVKNIFRKLDAGARTEAVAIARRRGLIQDDVMPARQPEFSQVVRGRLPQQGGAPATAPR
jgi:DNA-binding NarL/FixJ family response regulator